MLLTILRKQLAINDNKDNVRFIARLILTGGHNLNLLEQTYLINQASNYLKD